MNARLIGTAVIAALVAVGCGKKDGSGDADKADAKPSASKHVEEILFETMVAIPGKNYKIGKTEVTQAQWAAVMGENPSRFKGARRSWRS